jgi:PadR family transcriptional regulator PadR
VVPSEEGPHRKDYGITPQGRTSLGHQRKQWDEFSRTLSDLLEGEAA